MRGEAAEAFERYQSPMSWRYGSEAMRRLWSEAEKRRIWRRIWVALAEAQARVGLVSAAQVADLRAHMEDIDIDRAHALEVELMHDLMAEVHTWAEQCPVGGGIIHLGATSMDIEDNADALRLRAGCDLLLERVEAVIGALCAQVEAWAEVPTMAFTHLQPAEPTTVGYRLAQTLQDLDMDGVDLRRVREELRGKGFKGAVGTSASYGQLLAGTDVTAATLESWVMEGLGLSPFAVTTQTYPRKQDLRVLNVLAQIAQTLYKFAFDLRLLQSPVIGEWGEPFGKRQIGSSAMPFKRNPINAENIDSLGRMVANFPRVAWDNAAHSLLERTLDDSANRRSVLPEAFLATEELLRRAERLVVGLQVDRAAVGRTLATYGVFAATERLLMEAVKRGGDRQVLHEVIRARSLEAWAATRAGEANPLAASLAADPAIVALMGEAEALTYLDASAYVGDAPERCRRLVDAVRQRWD